MITAPPTPRCSAHTLRDRPGPYGLQPVPCNATRGLITVVAADGTELHACPAFGHRAQVAAKAARMGKP